MKCPSTQAHQRTFPYSSDHDEAAKGPPLSRLCESATICPPIRFPGRKHASKGSAAQRRGEAWENKFARRSIVAMLALGLQTTGERPHGRQTGWRNRIHRSVAALLGATSAGLVRSTTMLVICGAPRFSKKKIETARAFGIPICTEDEFLQKLDGIDLGDLVK